MKTVKEISCLVLSLRSLAFAIILIGASNCTTQEDFVKPEEAQVVEAASPEGAAEVSSITVSGAFIEYTDQVSCAECSYVVPEGTTVVDGAELGIEPGDVVCLSKGLKYNAIEFVNVEGQAGKPIIVGNCGE